MRRLFLVTLASSTLVFILIGASLAGDPHLPDDFDLSGMWKMPGPNTNRVKSMPDREPYFWNTEVMKGRDWLRLEPAEPFGRKWGRRYEQWIWVRLRNNC